VVPSDSASLTPVRLIESGPAAGAVAAADYAREAGESSVLSFDMGGTTAKLCLIPNGQPMLANDLEVARYERFLGVRAQALSHGCHGCVFALAQGVLRLCVPRMLDERFGCRDWPQPSMPVAQVVKVDSLVRCAQRLDDQGVPYRREADGALRVAPEDACGAFLIFRA